MGSYIPATGEERKAMLASLGLTSEEELFRVVPEKVRASDKVYRIVKVKHDDDEI